MRSIHVAPRPPGRFDVKIRYFPSGDQRGLLLSVLGDVKRVAAPPLVGATHTSRWYLLSRSLIVCTVNATRPPSGDIAGALSVVSLYQSAGVKARFACAPSMARGAVRAATAANVHRMERLRVDGKVGKISSGMTFDFNALHTP